MFTQIIIPPRLFKMRIFENDFTSFHKSLCKRHKRFKSFSKLENYNSHVEYILATTKASQDTQWTRNNVGKTSRGCMKSFAATWRSLFEKILKYYFKNGLRLISELHFVFSQEHLSSFKHFTDKSMMSRQINTFHWRISSTIAKSILGRNMFVINIILPLLDNLKNKACA